MFKILATDGCTLQETCATQPLCHQGRKPVWLQCRENFIPYIPIHMYSPEGSCFSGYRINIFDSEGACTVEQLSETQIKKSWIQLPDFHGISGDKASAKAPPENLGGEKQREKLWFRTTLSSQLWMLQCHRPFANVTYMQIPLAPQRLPIQENTWRLNKIWIWTHTHFNLFWHKKTNSFLKMEAILSPICYPRWFSETQHRKSTIYFRTTKIYQKYLPHLKVDL